MGEHPPGTGHDSQPRAATATAAGIDLEMRGIVKQFPGVLANDHVDFDVHRGEIHTLLGENGAGKSTLMKILYGLHQPDDGLILINGEPVTIHSPADAIAHGIGMIHQHFMLVETITVAENVALGLPSSRGLLMDLKAVSERIDQLSETYGIKVDPKAYVWQLSVGEQQRVEIIKALYRNAALLALDEPTAVLTPQEVEDLFVTLRAMAAEGHPLIFISHKLHEVLDISDRITVLRDGRRIGTVPARGATRASLAKMMVGRDVILERDRRPAVIGDTRLEVRGLSSLNDRGLEALRDIDLEVRSGEILAIAGVSGNGQQELAQVIAGLRTPTAGTILLDGTDVTLWRPGKRRAAGLAYIPEKRMRDGTIQQFTVAENLILHNYDKPPYAKAGFLDFGEIQRHCEQLIQDFQVKTPTQDTPLKALSGGNIQKMILARELSDQPKVLIAAQPTRGVDIGATEYIHQRLLDQRLLHETLLDRREAGTATLLISEDLDEILALADRIAVLYEGRIMGIVAREDATVEQLGLMMAGVTESDVGQDTN
ncbi:MAG TPA: ABC transporter ATP-binding protein [Actinobacteria bacterium]|nr:ABC transporter ATP-binding protein [Actinomycetota bacterium]